MQQQHPSAEHKRTEPTQMMRAVIMCYHTSVSCIKAGREGHAFACVTPRANHRSMPQIRDCLHFQPYSNVAGLVWISVSLFHWV